MTNKIVFGISLLIAAALANAEQQQAFEPKSQPNNLILIAKSGIALPDWVLRQEQQTAQNPTAETQVELVSAYLQLARQPGWSRYFDKAQQLLKSVALQHPAVDFPEYWLALADSAQQQHQFGLALSYLAKVQAIEPNSINAILMASRIYLVQNDTKAALDECKKLVGQQELFLLSLCSLEVTGRQGKTKDSYQALQLLARQQQALPLAQRQWLMAVLAEQAEMLAQHKQARSWLEQVLLLTELQSAPLPLWVKWADLSLEHDALLVFQTLEQLHRQQPLEDALLLRLALAERDSSSGKRYQQLIQHRVLLREDRQDSLHSADLAHYYLRLSPDPAKALYYAQLNAQQAKEPDDYQLLTKALAHSNQASPSSGPVGDHP